MTGQSKVISFSRKKNDNSAIDQINEFLKNPLIKPINISVDSAVSIYFIKRNILNNIFCLYPTKNKIGLSFHLLL